MIIEFINRELVLPAELVLIFIHHFYVSGAQPLIWFTVNRTLLTVVSLGQPVGIAS